MKWLIIFLIYSSLLYGYRQHSIKQLYSSSAKKVVVDTRITRLNAYFTARKSPLASEAAYFIKRADFYKLDWRLLPAIAGVESGFETAGNLHDKNPFGYMCGSSPCVFKSYREGIDMVAKTISRGSAYSQYQRSGAIIDLAEVYCQVRNEEWTQKILYFMNKL